MFDWDQFNCGGYFVEFDNKEDLYDFFERIWILSRRRC